ncbi:N-alpha-acetyltransferase 30; AltName: Full=L-A virus GAG protein N-acetyltransferase subunit MAK3; AltName: Full=Maintenance of killer protein 3; AltName: Full=N-terminal acetyltransferase C complex catalytic subunit MAK3; Short=NatC complex subunit MAK3; AltName: Full=NatC catalytic subunit [Serendipita indica DSM 11827]|nr:N-alpha-acetyltransferase 30; AltName: Full=L-A virus GAG protein N-acetyltransferase subunit MAK3; AltName: Full=Maintenance of killer protein 3; AltName: Full=N-terminal acetyltransferase C complex catalytic subunit MAK3; Short=NatC complex subunit MAK3; AltName: Full=NatC catalytic subunit [Serendipita indica DSM 11827]
MDKVTFSNAGVFYRQYNGESDLRYIMSLVQNELSEPYVIYTYRYFLQGWPNLSFLAFPELDDTSDPDVAHAQEPIGVIVCKQSLHKGKNNRGYIAMLSVDRAWRKRGIASTLVKLSIDMMTRTGADEIVLETEVDNTAALGLYASLGFIREKRLYRFYMNGKDAFRLVLPVIPEENLFFPSAKATAVTDKAVQSSTVPIAVPQPMHISSLGTAKHKVVMLETPPSPGLLHASTAPPATRLNKTSGLGVDGERFALGGLLGAAAPRSVESTDSFALYGAHIPASISPPIPPRPTGNTDISPRNGSGISVRGGAVTGGIGAALARGAASGLGGGASHSAPVIRRFAYDDDDDDYYISGR